MDQKTLRGWLERGEEVTVVGVRHAEDHSEWSIPGSVNLDAYDALKAGNSDAMADLDVPRGRPVVTVCGAGRSSAVAAEQLRERGYEALTLVGGMKAWASRGTPPRSRFRTRRRRSCRSGARARVASRT